MKEQKLIFMIWAIFCFMTGDISHISGLNEYMDDKYSSDILAYTSFVSLSIMGWVTYVLYPRKD